MRKIEYNWDLPADASPFYECHVGNDLIFIVNCKAEARTPFWLRQEMWNRIFELAEQGPAPRRRVATEAEIIPIDDLRAKREVRKAGQA